jgi:hypothetical protein
VRLHVRGVAACAQVTTTLQACVRDRTFVQLPGVRYALCPKPAAPAAPPPRSPAAAAAAAAPPAAAPAPPPPPPSTRPASPPPAAPACEEHVAPSWLLGRRMRGWWGVNDGWYAGCVARVAPGGAFFTLRYDLTNRDPKADVNKRQHPEEKLLWPLHRNPDKDESGDNSGPYQLLGAPTLPAVAADKDAKPTKKGGRVSYPYASVLRLDATDERVRLGDWVSLRADDSDAAALAGAAPAAAARYPARLLAVEADAEEKDKGGGGGGRRAGGNATITVLHCAPLPAGTLRKFPGAPSRCSCALTPLRPTPTSASDAPRAPHLTQGAAWRRSCS